MGPDVKIILVKVVPLLRGAGSNRVIIEVPSMGHEADRVESA